MPGVPEDMAVVQGSGNGLALLLMPRLSVPIPLVALRNRPCYHRALRASAEARGARAAEETDTFAAKRGDAFHPGRGAGARFTCLAFVAGDGLFDRGG